jgi:hypothetical protein
MPYTLKQAAEVTGYSVKALRLRIQKQALEAEKVHGKFGEEYIIPDGALERSGLIKPTPDEAGNSSGQGEEQPNQVFALVTRQQQEIAVGRARIEAIEQTLEVEAQHITDLRAERDHLKELLAKKELEVSEARAEVQEWVKRVTEPGRKGFRWPWQRV